MKNAEKMKLMSLLSELKGFMHSYASNDGLDAYFTEVFSEYTRKCDDWARLLIEESNED